MGHISQLEFLAFRKKYAYVAQNYYSSHTPVCSQYASTTVKAISYLVIRNYVISVMDSFFDRIPPTCSIESITNYSIFVFWEGGGDGEESL